MATPIYAAFDPRYVRKSVKHIPGVGYFHSGWADGQRWGLEFSGIAGVDLAKLTAMHLKASYSVRPQDGTKNFRQLNDYFH